MAKLCFIENTEHIQNWEIPMPENTYISTTSYHGMQCFKINKIHNTGLVY